MRSLLVSVWSDRTLRAVFGCTLATNLLVVGPLLVGVPTLAHARFVDGALAFGLVMSANGGGTLIGLALAASLPTPAPHRFGPVLVSVISALGIGVALLGLSPTALAAGAVAAGMGVANGYVLIQFVTWLQTRTPPEMLGRMMSLLLFSQVGLLPVSTALTGALLSLHITGLFVGAGALMTGLMLFASRTEAMRGMGLRASVVPGSTLAAE